LEVEQYIVDGGIVLIKFWLEVGKEEQERRFSSHSRSAATVELSPMISDRTSDGTNTRKPAT
jgi:polyphosphate kinase 2 (PPK2 family)